MTPLDEAYSRAASSAEFPAIERQWQADQRAAAEQNSDLARRLDDLTRRLAALEQRPRGLTKQFINNFVRDVGEIVGQKLAETEQKLRGEMLTYAGAYDERRDYAPNSLVTYSGALWITTAATPAQHRPGKSPAWRLIAKAGSVPPTKGVVG